MADKAYFHTSSGYSGDDAWVRSQSLGGVGQARCVPELDLRILESRAAERAFDLMADARSPTPASSPILVYSRFNHPNAEMLEDKILPLETGAQAALIFNSGMAAIMTLFLLLCIQGKVLSTRFPIYGGTQHLIQDFLSTLGIIGIPRGGGRFRGKSMKRSRR